MSISKYPLGRFGLTVSFGCAPANVEALIKAALEEIKNVGVNGPLPEDINKFKAESARSHELELKTNSFWLGYLNNQLNNHEQLNQIESYDARMRKVNVQSVKETAAKYLNGDNYIRLVLMPEK